MSSPVTTDPAMTHSPCVVGPIISNHRTQGSPLGTLGLIGEVVAGGVEEQAKLALKNLRAVVEAPGGDFGTVVKATVFLNSMGDFAVVNRIYEQAFGTHKPAWSTIEVECRLRELI